MQELNDKVSVIVPVYNVETYLTKCLDSLVNQTHKNLEIILIDDGSKDNSGKICESFAAKDERIIVIHQKNSGVSKARNVGLDKMTGNYIIFVDADDYLEFNAVEKLLNILIAENADIVFGEEKEVFKEKVKYVPRKEIEKYDTDSIKEIILLDKIQNYVWNRLYKAEIWDNIRFPENLVYEDLYIMPSACIKAKKIVYRCEPVYYYNKMNAGSITAARSYFNAYYRYGKFKAYCEHERIAWLLNKPQIVEWAKEKELHEIVKAFVRNYGSPCLTDGQINEMNECLQNNKTLIKKLNLKDRCLMWSIFKFPLLCKIYGKILYIIFKFRIFKNSLHK